MFFSYLKNFLLPCLQASCQTETKIFKKCVQDFSYKPLDAVTVS